MIEYAHVDERKRVAQSHGDEFVCATRFGDSRGVIVRKDHCDGVVRERLPQYFTRVYAGAVDNAAEKFFGGDQAVSDVEIKAAEYLVWSIMRLRVEKASSLEGRTERDAGA